MNLDNYRLLYVFSCVVLCLVILSPTLAQVVSLPEGEKFSELWLLGTDRMLEGYPFDVSEGVSYNVSLGVRNQMGGLQYYRVYVKFRNQSEPLPNSTAGLPSPLAPIFEYSFFLGNNETWEREVSFSFEGVSFEENSSRVSKVLVGDYAVDVNKTAVWDEAGDVFYYQLFFELWVYDSTVSYFQFHNRWVSLRLNMGGQL